MLGRNWGLQHDNDPIHIVMKWLDEKGVERVKWPSFTPDLNHLGRR